MLFVTSLHSIYYDIYKLVKLGFSAEYVESISPAERGVYQSYHKMEQESGNTDDNERAANSVGLDIKDL